MDFQLEIRQGQRRYHLEVDDFGRISYQDYDPEWHRHAVYHLILISSGSCYLEFGGGDLHLLTRKQLVFINPLTPHRFRCLAGISVEHTTMLWRFVDARGVSASFSLQELYGKEHRNCEPYLIHTLSESVFTQVKDEHQNVLNHLRGGLAPLPLSVLYFRFWSGILELLRSRDEKMPEPPFAELCGQIRKILTDVIGDAAFGNRNLAAILGKHHNYLNWRFRRATGMSIRECLIKMRLQKAQELLRGSRMQIAEIAESCGFRSSCYFSRCFRHGCGMTPNEFRKSGNSLPGFIRQTESGPKVGTPYEAQDYGNIQVTWENPER